MLYHRTAEGWLRGLSSLFNRGQLFVAISLSTLAGCGSSATTTAVIPQGPAAVLGASDDWITLQHDMRRSGYTANSGIAQSNVGRLQLNWSLQIENEQFFGSPIVVNGTLYAAGNHGAVVAINARDGSLLWNTNLPGSIKTTPALYDGTLFVALHNEGAPSPVYALNPENGEVLWQQLLPGPIKSAPVAIDGTLFVGVAGGDSPYCLPSGVYALNEKTGATTLSWLTFAGSPSAGGGVWSPISTDGTNLYFGTGNTCENDSQANSIISSTTQLQDRWTLQTAPSNIDDDVGGGVLLTTDSPAKAIAIGKNGTLYAIDVQNGTRLWSLGLGAFDTGGGYSTPAFNGEMIIASGGLRAIAPPYGGILSGLTPQGTVVWTIDTTDVIWGSAAMTSDLAFVNVNSSIQALDPLKGNVLWSYPTVGTFVGSPAIGPSGVLRPTLQE